MILHIKKLEVALLNGWREMKTRLIIASASILLALFVPEAVFAEQQTYKVIKGDSLYRISKSFNMTPEALKELNGLKNDKIIIGQILKVSAEVPAAQVKTIETLTIQSHPENAANTDNQEQPQILQTQQIPEETQTYTVRQGDTISGIARSFNLRIKDITAANNLKNNNSIKIGQIIKIPTGNNVVIRTPQIAKPTEETSAAAAAVQRVANLKDLKSPASEGKLSVRDRLVEAGFNLLGVRYRYGGTSEKTGLDCSALVKNLFAKFGLTLPRSSREQYKQGEKVTKEDLQKGDLVFFSSGGKTPTHVGIYIGDNQFLHAASKAKKVIVSDLSKTWYDLRYLGARRIMDLWWEDAQMSSTENPSFEWADQLLYVWEDSQIPLNEAPQETLNMSILRKEQ